MPDDFAEQVASISALAEPARRALYLFVVAQPEPVSRDQAAAGTGLPRHTAKFHLDRLVEEGLLTTEFRRLSGRSGPGAGRPAKLYLRSESAVAVTLPERHYDLAAQILADAVETAAADEIPVLDAVQRAASEAGHRLGAGPDVSGDGPTAAPGRAPGRDAEVRIVAAALAGQGYEPRQEGNALVLANCPFHDLARTHTALVCGMNLALVTALLDGARADHLAARLEPADGRCCVTIRP
jgi:predicted ArsR family transcriptional regulator